MEDKNNIARSIAFQHWKDLFTWETWRLKDGVENRRLLAQLLSFGIIYLGLYGLISFLLPLELRRVRVFVLLVLLVYAIVEHILIRLGILRNFYDLVDENQPAWREPVFLLMSVLLAGLPTWVLHRVPYPLACGLWLGSYALHTFLSHQLFLLLRLERLKSMGHAMVSRRSLVWILSIAIVVAFVRYYEPLRVDISPGTSLRTYIETVGSNPLNCTLCWRHIWSAQVYLDHGVLFALQRDKNYIPLETGNDSGATLLYVFAAFLGFIPSQLTGALIINSVYILGCLGFALLAGIIIYRSPSAFLTISVALLMAYKVFEPTIQSNGVEYGSTVGIVLIEMALLISLPRLSRSDSFSTILWGAAGCGIAAGLVSLVRANVGLPVFLAFLLVLVGLLAARRKKFILIVIAILALLCGKAFVSMAYDGLLLYRNAKLKITSYPFQAWHIVYHPLLGGIQEVGWDDAIIGSRIWMENPLVIYLTPEYEEVGKRIYFDYIISHPQEYLEELIKNTIDSITYLFDQMISSDWLIVFYAVLFLASGGCAIEKVLFPNRLCLELDLVADSITALILMAILIAAPLILTVHTSIHNFNYIIVILGAMVTTLFLGFQRAFYTKEI